MHTGTNKGQDRAKPWRQGVPLCDQHSLWVTSSGCPEVATPPGSPLAPSPSFPPSLPPSPLPLPLTQAAGSWEGERDGTGEPVTCAQMNGQWGLGGVEDCLILNVYSPVEVHLHLLPCTQESGAPLPVLVYIHGGGLTQGSSAGYGPQFLMDYGVSPSLTPWPGGGCHYKLSPRPPWLPQPRLCRGLRQPGSEALSG